MANDAESSLAPDQTGTSIKRRVTSNFGRSLICENIGGLFSVVGNIKLAQLSGVLS
jgi:hypothetical protein